MLKVIEREVVRKYHMLRRPFMDFGRASVFGKTEAAGVDLNGSWDETQLLMNEVGAYSSTQNTLAFYDSRNSKGSFITDVDGNTLLDMSSMENLPLGYNNEAFTAVSI